MIENAQLVFPSRGRWKVKTYLASRAAKVFDSETDAISWAKSKCKKNGLDLFVHNRDGVRYRYSYKKHLSKSK